MGTMSADGERLSDHIHDPRCRPDLPSTSEGFCAFRQHTGHVRHLFGAQSRMPAGRRLVPQGFDSLCLRFFEPVTGCALADSQGLSDVFVFPSVLMPFPGTHPSSFAPMLGRSRFLVHTSLHRHVVLVLSFFQYRSIVCLIEQRNAVRPRRKSRGPTTILMHRCAPGARVGSCIRRGEKSLAWVRVPKDPCVWLGSLSLHIRVVVHMGVMHRPQKGLCPGSTSGGHMCAL